MDKVTKDQAIRVILFGGCKDNIVGKSISDFSQSDLIWGERILTHQERKATERPLWVLSGYGSGDGYGSGYGYGDGDGSGYGYSYGSGSGSGYGSSYGSGYGYSYGDSYGNGSGSGSGDGYGSGKCKDIGEKINSILKES